MSKSITILGATGSVGTATLDLISRGDPGEYDVLALTAHSNVAELARLAKRFKPEVAVIADPTKYSALLAELSGEGIKMAAGEDALIDAARMGADWTMAAIVGAAGLRSTAAALEAGKTLAIANKECLVCAGDTFMARARTVGATVLPVDSEHNAIFQAIYPGHEASISHITLTASGGPFREWSRGEMAAVTREEALAHPVWDMGAKISVDSATLMNKGLEVIEACRLFSLPSAKVEVVVHPQSVIHGLVHYEDGSVLAQLGSPDMRVPIASTLAWPERMKTPCTPLDLVALGKLEFAAPDTDRFPALRLARQALDRGEGATCALNAANEIAVEAFLNDQIGFLDIIACVEDVLDEMEKYAGLAKRFGDMEQALLVDAEARAVAQKRISSFS